MGYISTDSLHFYANFSIVVYMSYVFVNNKQIHPSIHGGGSRLLGPYGLGTRTPTRELRKIL